MRGMRLACHAGRPLGPAAVLLALLLWGIRPLGAQPVGWAPRSTMIQGPYGYLYGTTSQSANGYGTVFKMTRSGTLTTLHNFGPNDGSAPNSLTLGQDSMLYGTTPGTIFKIKPGGEFSVLYDFSFTSGGANYPSTLTEGKDGNFYGTTLYGGSGTVGNTLGPGTIFKITPSGTFTTLYNFTGGADGAGPSALTLGKDGNFYGTANGSGSGASQWGTVFKITPSGTFTTLYSFSDGNDGAYPRAGLTLGKDGNFYGTTASGGVNQWGVIFKITPSGALTTLYTFTGGSDGGAPQAALDMDKQGNFYSTNSGGGAAGDGVIFQLTPSGTLITLFNFTTSGDPSFGADNRQAGVTLGGDGNLYGLTEISPSWDFGPISGGTLFQLTSSGVATTLHTFTFGGPVTPEAALTLDNSGSFYGTTAYGGTTNNGTVFTLTPAGKLRVLHSFSGSDGAQSSASLTLGKNRNFYGVTSAGGANEDGTIFKITPSGTFTTLYNFTGGNDGANPTGALTLGKDGNLYGTAQYDGAYGGGTIFKITPAGNFTVLYAFSAYDPTTYTNADGANPISALTLDKDGNFYGETSYFGGANGWGTVFKVTPSGAFTTLYSFTGGNDGSAGGTLTLGKDGNFYGNANPYGPSSGAPSAIFQITPTGAFTTLYTFTGGSDGGTPNALTLGSDGNFYGTTQYGGAYNNSGTIFQITPSGTLTTLYSFNQYGADYGVGDPSAALTLGKDGNFYGPFSAVSLFSGAGIFSSGGGVFQFTSAGTLTPILNFGGI